MGSQTSCCAAGRQAKSNDPPIKAHNEEEEEEKGNPIQRVNDFYYDPQESEQDQKKNKSQLICQMCGGKFEKIDVFINNPL